jgi:hypothetical protein
MQQPQPLHQYAMARVGAELPFADALLLRRHRLLQRYDAFRTQLCFLVAAMRNSGGS